MTPQLNFASDNAGPVHAEIMDALQTANADHHLPYGNDDITTQAIARVREVFEAPDAQVWFVGTGTAANVLALSAMATPFQSLYCSPVAHIHEDECNGYEFHSGGGKLVLVGTDDKMTSQALADTIDFDIRRGQTPEQLGPVSITQATERGRIYTPDEVANIAQVARDHNLHLHMDGARFANALVAAGCSPAEMTWKAGVDALSFGGTKNGCLGVEAVIFFNPDLAPTFGIRRQRGGHTFSKHRYLAAQMQAYLTDDLWLKSAHTANKKRARLEAGLRKLNTVKFDFEPQANMMFIRLPQEMHTRLQQAGARYYVSAADDAGLRPVRLVCDWSISDDAIDKFIDTAADR